MKATCPVCGREFEKGKRSQVYCSRSCFYMSPVWKCGDERRTLGVRSAMLGIRVREIAEAAGERYGFEPRTDDM